MTDSIPRIHNSVAVLFSGGVDSTVLVGWMLHQGYRVQPLYVRGGLIWERAELPAAERVVKALHARHRNMLAEVRVLSMPVDDLYGRHWSTTGRAVPDRESSDEAVHLPGRNPLLLLKASLWCADHGIHRLAIGTLSRNPFRDATEAFFRAFEQMLWEATGTRIRILRPFASLTKEELLSLGAGLPLEQTFSCLSPVRGAHCGECNKCAERQRALATPGRLGWNGGMLEGGNGRTEK